MFSVLQSLGAVEGATVVDLFAGSGALGVEALSRGAKRVVFVDRSAVALRCIRRNVEVIPERAADAVVIGQDALAFAREAGPYDLWLVDPPYAWDGWEELLGLLEARAGILVAEAPGPLKAGPGWETVRMKRYGVSVLTVAKPIVRHSKGEPAPGEMA
jgi:16S rRNA (guanine966-N2)-methyltransferase